MRCPNLSPHKLLGTLCLFGQTNSSPPAPPKTFSTRRCALRWWLSRWNYKLAGSWAWFPAGTFAANMLGTGIDCALQVGADQNWGASDSWGALCFACFACVLA